MSQGGRGKPELTRADGFFGHEATVFDKEGGLVQIRPDWVAARRCKVRIEEIELPPVVFELQAEDDGTVWCRSVSITVDERPGVTTAKIRSVPFRRLLREAIAAASDRSHLAPDGTLEVMPMRWKEIEEEFLSSTPRQTNPILTDDLLKRVADTYRANPKAPARAVHEDLQQILVISRATAGRYIKEARARGFLGPAMPRKAGEAPAQAATTHSLEGEDR